MANNNQIQLFTGFDQLQVDTIRHTLAKDATPEQFNLFMSTAVAAGLNPMLNHIYCIVYGGKMSIQISVEGIMFLAKRVEGYEGIDVQLVYENDVFRPKRVRDESGRYYWDVEHEIADDPGKVKACYAFAYRTGFPPVFEHIKVDEVQHHLSGNNAANWKKYFNDFFKKTVVKRAAKRQYGIEISEDDAPEATASVQSYERRDITDEVNAAAATEQKQSAPSKDDAAKIATLKGIVSKKLEQLGCTKETKGEYIAKLNLFADPQNPTLAEWEKVLKTVDMAIAEKEAAEDLPTE
ncbi:RecT family recombinase [Paenibacillus cymbidii]|uniref:RecT family recombinase n=1 Tax=Paenibacillus cymbidii TaxID=1639034 RepID=UPI001436BFF6|nr:RecT family recombinase [Paenibacillus cymbidii]